MPVEKIEGLIAATPTPMNADGSIRPELIDKQAELLSRNGVVGAFVCGTVGESLSLTVQERMELAEGWVHAAGEGFKVIVHVGHTSIRDCKALAAHAEKIGAWAIAAMAPCYFKPACPDDLAAFFGELAAAAPKLAFYYYHIPSMTGVNLAMVDFFNAARGKIPNLAGVKYTWEDLTDFKLAMDFEGGRYDMLFGRDEMLLSALALGARGAIGGTFNYAAPLYVRMIEAFDAGDMETARKLQKKSIELADCFRNKCASPLAYQKAIMKITGLDLGPVRLPLVDLTDGQFRRLQADLEAISFAQFCCK
ncbi:MAG: dihydrodipicolinate synthase family protein [Planctomycetota bacterium]|jgi:N-acetylneuraminate lyase